MTLYIDRMVEKLDFRGVFFNFRGNNFLRRIVNLRTNIPLVYILLQFISGQLLGIVFNSNQKLLTTVIIAFIYIFAYLSKRQHKLYLLVILVGMLITNPEIPLSDEELSFLNNQPSLTGIITNNPRRRKIGMVEFGILLPELNRKLLCKEVEYPWDQNHVEVGSVVSFTAKINNFNAKKFSLYNKFLLIKGYSAGCLIRDITTSKSGHSSTLDTIKKSILNKFNSLNYQNETKALFMSLVFGLRDMLSDRTETSFKKLGIAHLLVLSGYQLTQFFYLTEIVLKYLLLNMTVYRFFSVRLISSIVSYIVVLIFTLICGIEASSLRALIALSLTKYAVAKGVDKNFINLTIASYLIMAFMAPESIVDPSVHLTYAALTGIILAEYESFRLGFWGIKLKENTSDGMFIKYLKVSFWIVVCTSLVSDLWFGLVSPIAFIINPIWSTVISLYSLTVAVTVLLLDLFSKDLSQTIYLYSLNMLELWRKSNVIITEEKIFDFFFCKVSCVINLAFCSLIFIRKISCAKRFFKPAARRS